MPAGPQDRVIQDYGSVNLWKAVTTVSTSVLDPKLLPRVYVGYRETLSQGSEVFRNNIRERWRAGDFVVLNAMKTSASYAERGRAALLNRDYDEVGWLIDANFDLRCELYRIIEGNLAMVGFPRKAAATATSGSGGGIVAIYRDGEMFECLKHLFASADTGTLKRQVSKPFTASARAAADMSTSDSLSSK